MHNTDMPVLSDHIRANIFWMDKVPFNVGDILRFRCATQDVACEIEKINTVIDSSSLEVIAKDAIKIKNREVTDIIIRTEKSVVIKDFNKVEAFGRFVLGTGDTLAGRIIMKLGQ